MSLIVAGLPASGKSTFAASLGGRILEFDSIAKKYGSYDELNEEKDKAFSIFKMLVAVNQPDVVVDVFSSRNLRMEILDALDGNASIVIAICPLAVCLARNMRRQGSMVSNKDIQQSWMTFEPILLNEGYKAIYEWNSLLNKIHRIA